MSVKSTKHSDKLLENVQHLLCELTAKRFNLSTWIQKALLYYNRRQFESFVLLLESGISKSGKSYKGYKDDLIRSYILLAAYFTRVAYRETGNRRAALHAKVTNLFNAVDELQPNKQKYLVIRGYALMLTAARAQEADNHFVTILKETSSNIPSLLGRGCLAYNRQEYFGALGYFKSVLMYYPRGPCDVRVGVGHCFLKLHNADSARRAFELALEYNGKCQNALVGMAILKLNVLEKQSHQEGINLMCAAFEQFNRHPVVLTCLASHHFYAKKYEMVRTLAANAIIHTDSSELRAQNYYQIGRSYHATKNYDQAFDFYKMALKARPEGYGPPHLGLAQMYLRLKQIDKATICLETLLKIMPDQLDGLRLLSLLYIRESSASKVDMAVEMLKKAMSLSRKMSKEYDIWLNLAKAYEHKELWPEAINSYEQAMKIHEEQGLLVPIELLNNLAVAQIYGKKPNDALVNIERALFTLTNRKYPVSESTKNNRLTLRFNRARVLEELNRDDVAESLYKELIDECPTYYDCYIGLGRMAAKRNQCVIAMDYYKDVLKVDNDNMTVRSIMGNYYMKQGMTTQAMYCHNVILRRRESRRDPYTMVSVGNVCLINIHRSMATGDDRTAKRHQEKAIQLYRRALEENPRNMWAANGIGAALCSRGFLIEGEAIFKQILESGKQCTQAMINSANVALELQQYKQASQTYKHCLEEHLPPNSLDIMHLLARSLYQGDRVYEAKIMLLKARHIMPYNAILLYNLGLTIKECSVMTFGMQRLELADLNRAEHELKVALRYFDFLKTGQMNSKVSKRAAFRQANKCRQILINLPEEHTRVQTQEQLEEDRRLLQEQRYQELQKQLEEQRLQRLEEEIQLRENQKVKRLEILQRTKSILNTVANKEKKPPPPPKRSNKKTGLTEGGNNDEDNMNPGPSKRGRKGGEATAKRSRKSYKSKALVVEDTKKPPQEEPEYEAVENDQTEDYFEEPNFEPNDELVEAPNDEPNSEPDDEPNYEPNSEPDDEPNYEPNSEPDDEPNYEPNSEPDDEPNYEPNSEPDDEPNYEPNSEPDDEPNYEPNSEPDDEPNYEPNSEPDDEPNSKPNSKPNSELIDEPNDERKDEPNDEPTDEPNDEPKDKPNDELNDESVEESENLMNRLKTISQRRQVEMDNFMDARDSGKLDQTEAETPEMIFEYVETLKKKMQNNSK